MTFGWVEYVGRQPTIDSGGTEIAKIIVHQAPTLEAAISGRDEALHDVSRKILKVEIVEICQ
jgi:hypothetical protein